MDFLSTWFNLLNFRNFDPNYSIEKMHFLLDFGIFDPKE